MHNICISCLAWDRQLFPVDKYTSVLSDITQSMKVFVLQGKVCWECKAYLRKIQFFKERTLQSINLLQQYGDVNKLKQQHTIQPVLSRSKTRIVDCAALPKPNSTVVQTNDSILTNKVYYISQAGSQYIINGIDKLSPPVLLPINQLVPLNNGNVNDGNVNDGNVNPSIVKTENVDMNVGVSVKVEPIDDVTIDANGDVEESIVHESEELDCVIDCIIENPPKKEKIHKSQKMRREPEVTEMPGAWTSELVSDSQMLKWRAADENDNKYLVSRYKCTQCVIGFVNAQSWRNHHDIYHNRQIGQYVCDVCQMRFAEEYILNEHRDNHKRLYKCVKCPFTNRRSALIIEHCKTAHSGTENNKSQCNCVGKSSCDKCRNKNKTETRHIAYNYSYKCGVCSEHEQCSRMGKDKQQFRIGMLSRTKILLRVGAKLFHKSQHLGSPPIRQSIFFPQNTDQLGDLRPYGCGDCDKKFRFSGELLSHRLLFHRRQTSTKAATSSSKS
ncbi:Zinc finger protein 485 [Eumeta japonica]|uniref:Zinc finger protein 485 n=1 Tax=Eumeta variegata TaxID=151549 RepID=A0A4C1XNB3_EUMVA|nr:Zinc finger protein 485 [Eumeta japonica]